MKRVSVHATDEEWEAAWEKVDSYLLTLSEVELSMLQSRIDDFYFYRERGREPGRSKKPHHAAMDKTAVAICEKRREWLKQNPSSRGVPSKITDQLIEAEIAGSDLLSALYQDDPAIFDKVKERIYDKTLVGK